MIHKSKNRKNRGVHVKLLEDIINMKLIGIIGAMEVEVASLKEMMTDVTIRTKASMEFNHGYLNGKEVVVVRSGIGKVKCRYLHPDSCG